MARVELSWNPFDQTDPGPCIDVTVMNSRDVIEAGRAIGLDFPEPRPMKALLDTGASVTLISKTFANYCKLFQTSDSFEITAIGATHRCGEHAGRHKFSRYQSAAIRPHSHRFGGFRKRTPLRMFDWQRHPTELGYQLRWTFQAGDDHRLTGTARSPLPQKVSGSLNG
jgi:hypothetical protein